RGNHKQFASLTHTTPQRHIIPTAVLTQSKPVFNTAARPVSAALPKINVTRPRYAHPVVTKSKSSIRRHTTRSSSSKRSNSPLRVTAVKALVGNPQHALKDKRVIDSGCSRHMTGNMSYLYDFEELNGGYVAFGGNAKGGKITSKGKTKTDDAFDGKEHDLDVKKPKSEVNVSPSSSAQSRKQDDKTKKEDKRKCPVESFIGYRDLSAEFEDCSDNSSNQVNAAGSIVPTVGQNFLNSTNTFSADGTSNAAVSLTYEKSSFIDASQLPDDLDMPELEDITYSDDEDAVGAEADFNNLESSIPEEPNRVHQALKDPSWIKAMEKELLQFKMNKKDERAEILRKLRLTEGKSASTPIDTEKPLLKDPDGEDVDVHTYRSMIGSLMYLTSSRPDIKFASWLVQKQTALGKDKSNPLTVDSLLKTIWSSIHYHLTNEVLTIPGQTATGKEPQIRLWLVKQKKDGIFISQDKYVAEILRKFSLTEGKSTSTPIDTEKPLLKDPNVKRIFRYLKSKPHLGLWYPKDLPFDLVSYSDSDYAGASLDIKSTTGGCQFLGCRLISWQCKKQTVVATSSTEAEYVAAASCCAQVLWIQNQLLDYG
nr:uncharacterized mitochondrial protein AtMg00810-like [Tanacetum cinerariifolium]